MTSHFLSDQGTFDGLSSRLWHDPGRTRQITFACLALTDQFPGIATVLGTLPVYSVVIDGEAVVLNEQGKSDFGALQAVLGRKGRGSADQAVLFAFDLLFLDGHDLRSWKLEGRRDAQESLIEPGSRRVMLSEELEGDGRTIWAHACRYGLEGIVSKRRDAPYRSGRRNKWRKIKCVLSDTFVVIGYETTDGRQPRKHSAGRRAGRDSSPCSWRRIRARCRKRAGNQGATRSPNRQKAADRRPEGEKRRLDDAGDPRRSRVPRTDVERPAPPSIIQRRS